MTMNAYQRRELLKLRRIKAVCRLVALAAIAAMFIMGIKTLSIGIELKGLSNEVIIAEEGVELSPNGRINADKVYESVQNRRAKLYNSDDAYTRWICEITAFQGFLVFLGWMLFPIILFMDFILGLRIATIREIGREPRNSQSVRN